MSARSSFHFRSKFHVIKSSEPEGMSSLIADDLKNCVRLPAQPILPGETVAAQMRRSWERLGRPKWWRFKACWYCEGGTFSAAAAADIQRRFLSWKATESARAKSSASLERTRQEALDRSVLERSRSDLLAQLARVEARLSVIAGREVDPA